MLDCQFICECINFVYVFVFDDYMTVIEYLFLFLPFHLHCFPYVVLVTLLSLYDFLE